MKRTNIAAAWATAGALSLMLTGAAAAQGGVSGSTGQSGMTAAHAARPMAAERCAAAPNAPACLTALTGAFGPQFPAVADFAAAGPFATVREAAQGADCTIYRPETLGEKGLRHPIILWGHGTGAPPTSYAGLLGHLASHGFVVAAANTPNAGTGEQMLACLDWLEEQNGLPTGDYARKLNTFLVGTSGHSQGGGGSIMAGRDPRIRATAPLQPYVLGLGYVPGAAGLQNGPMLLLSGSLDTIARPAFNQLPVFNATPVPVFWGTLIGANHFVPSGSAGGYRGPITAWFRYHFMQDEAAGQLFYGEDCGLCVSSSWQVQRKLIF